MSVVSFKHFHKHMVSVSNATHRDINKVLISIQTKETTSSGVTITNQYLITVQISFKPKQKLMDSD